MLNSSKTKGAAGFSLVEVTLAIGILSFAMLPVMGLLPIGLKVARNSVEQAQAANIAQVLAESVRGATTADGTNYSSWFAGQAGAYAVGGETANLTIPNLTLEGTVNPASARFVAAVKIVPPPNPAAHGSAVISVAWPAVANPAWNSTSNAWDAKAEGSLTAVIQFLPRR